MPQEGEVMYKKKLKQVLACTLAFSVALGSANVPQKAKAAEETKASADVSSGLVGYYDFEDSLDNKASTTGGRAEIHGGAGDTWNSGTTGTENYADSIDGFGKAYKFLGDIGENRGEGLELDVKMPEEFTISYWVNPRTVEFGSSMVFSPVSLDEGLSIMDYWNKEYPSFPTVRVWKENDKQIYLDNFTAAVDSLCEKWTHITLTCDASDSYSLYINGKFIISGINETVANDLTGMPIFLGINYWDASFDGLMDEVRIYDRVLTADDIAELSIVPTTGIKISTGKCLVCCNFWYYRCTALVSTILYRTRI